MNSQNIPVTRGSLALLKCVIQTCKTPLHAIILLAVASGDNGSITPAELNTELDGFGMGDIVEDLLEDGLIEELIGAYSLTKAGEIEVMTLVGSVMLANEA